MLETDSAEPTPVRQVIRRGDLYWLTDASRGSIPGHPHPHLVLQEDVFNHSRIETVIVCALTSRLTCANEPGNILLAVGEGHLEKQSVIVVSQLSAVLKTQLGLYIGALSQQRVEQVLAGLRFQQAAFFRR